MEPEHDRQVVKALWPHRQAAQLEAVKALDGIATWAQTPASKRDVHQNRNQIQDGENAAAVTH